MDLITVRGAEILNNTDVVIYAGSLVNPKLISTYCSKDVSIYNSAKMTLEDVVKIEIDSVKAGRDVVRLHTGDPSLYSAIHEQIEILMEHDIPFDVTPGVSAFSAAAAAVGCELTIPNVSQSLTITRVDGRTRVPKKESLASYAIHHATLALYLSAGQAERVKEELIHPEKFLDEKENLIFNSNIKKNETLASICSENEKDVDSLGFSSETKAIVIYKASWPDQKIIRTTLGKMPERMKEEGIKNFALIIVGDVLNEGKINGEEHSKLYDKDFETGFRKINNNDSGKESFINTVDKAVKNANNKPKILIFSFTLHGDLVMQEIVSKYSISHPEIEFIGNIKHDALEPGTTKYIVSSCFSEVKAIIFVSAIGIAVREIAPFIKNKATDPAVVVVDELGENVIPILSGHLGGANDLARELSNILSASCIITTATDLEHKFSVDCFAKKHHFYITDLKKAKEVSAKVLSGKEIKINKGKTPDIIISPFKENDLSDESAGKYSPLILVPKCIAVGIGCRRGVSCSEIEDALLIALSENNIYRESIFAFATIDIKSDEKGLLEFFTKNSYDWFGLSNEDLKKVEGEFSRSEFVEKTVGVPNVSGRASFLLAKNAYEELPDSEKKYFEKPRLIMDKKAYKNVTIGLSLI